MNRIIEINSAEIFLVSGGKNKINNFNRDFYKGLIVGVIGTLLVCPCVGCLFLYYGGRISMDTLVK